MYRTMLAGVVALAAAAPVRAGAQDFFTETVKDFGTSPRGPVLVHYFTLKNTSAQPVTLGQPRVSCGCTSAAIVNNKTVVAPGDTALVAAMMDTKRIPQSGVVKSVIVYVPVISPFFEEAQLRVQAIARDDLVISPDALSFGTVRKGQGGKATTRLTLYNDPNWQVTEPTSSGAYVHAEAKPVSRQGSEVTFEVTATLDAACPVGNWTADVWVKTTAPGVDKLRLPVTVNVVAPIAVNPGSVTFGDVKVGEPSEQKVILQGTQPFTVTSVKGGDGVLAIDQVATGSRPVHILKLTLTPKAAGDVAQSLEITTDSREQPKVVVPVTAHVSK